MRITRLGEGVDASRLLQADAMERTFSTLRDYRELMTKAGVGLARVVATSAVRDAFNQGEFLQEASRSTGIAAEVLSGDDEAFYSYTGATAGLQEVPSRTFLIVDIGGGSTELATMINDEIVGVSMQIGCVRVTERALGKEAPTPSREKAARSMIHDELSRVLTLEPRLDQIVGSTQLLGLAGTVATLVQLTKAVAEYDRDLVHHQIVGREQVNEWRLTLERESPAERLKHPGMTPGREDVLVSGLMILEAVMDHFRVDELLSSENDILDGLVLTLRADSAPSSQNL
jgi:exopolyphosphatase/guanosine-5'-triphosphate,3'-diphosphate pyrophosphatase